MTLTEADAFARAWVAAWNDRDIEAILAHYDEAVVFHSPRIADVMGGHAASIAGKDNLRAYWLAGLERAPKLYFELDRVFAGSDTLTVLYTNHRDQMVTETFVFDMAGKIITAMAAYE